MLAKLQRVLLVVMAVILLGVAAVELKGAGVTAKAALAGLGGVVLALSAAAGKG